MFTRPLAQFITLALILASAAAALAQTPLGSQFTYQGQLRLLAACAAPAAAQPYSIPWHTIDAGGGTSSGGGYSLSGTIGQHDAGAAMTGTSPAGDYSLTGGFWAGIAAATPPICPGDWNGDEAVTSDDFFAFLTDFFAGDADFNDDGVTTSDDFFAFLTAFFEGC